MAPFGASRAGLMSVSADEIPDSDLLQIHLDATDSATLPDTTEWEDKSGNGFDLTGSYTEVATDRINGLDAVYFDGTDDLMDVAFGSAEAQPNYIYIVHEPKWGAASGETVFDADTADTARLFENSNGNESMFAGETLEGNATATQPQITEMVFDGSNSEIRRDDTDMATGDAGAADWDGVTLGARGDATNFCEVYIGEILGYYEQPDRASVYDYLSRWGTL